MGHAFASCQAQMSQKRLRLAARKINVFSCSWGTSAYSLPHDHTIYFMTQTNTFFCLYSHTQSEAIFYSPFGQQQT